MRCLQLLTIFCHFEIYQYLLLTVGRHGRDHIAAGQWFFPSSLVSHIDKTGRHDITEILLKVALNTITLLLTSLVLYTFPSVLNS
jgi:hypothetical protein